jgi:hypothetical protein
MGGESFTWATLLGWVFVHALGGIAGTEQKSLRSRSWIDEWLLGRLLLSAFEEQGLSREERHHAVSLIKVLTTHQLWFEQERPDAAAVLRTLLEDTEVQETVGINRYQEVLWYHEESLQQLITGLYLIGAVDALSSDPENPESCARLIRSRRSVLDSIRRAMETSEYRVERLLAAVSG